MNGRVLSSRACLGAIAAAAALRLYHLSRPSMWGDEACMLALATRPASAILAALASTDQYNDIAPPVYFLLLRAVVLALGATITAARLL